uniref:NADH dehydrogenase subunit 5 n=1 Tax=Megacopta bituminata TaxID=2968961 RepID=UPI002239032E|nr:NADH dehydrogenase subunit 5 [Megacopta bituminata]UYA97649.1 NADH dehydrogenase subunit 5 [Megacopta bituminata]
MSYFCFYKLWSLFLFIFGSIFLFIGLIFICDNYSIFFDWEIYTLNSVSIYMTLIFDCMSLIFMGCVLYISSMVIFYSSSYMFHDIFKFRFLLLVLLFIVSMMLLIISPNLVSILLGWDGLGLVSYCLVVYFQNMKSYNAGMLTILINRIGDVAILVSISWLLNMGGYNYYFCFYYSVDYFNWIGYLLLLAAFTKSAQIPFSSWLPAAMAAPTPVSALVHSSTLVTAGVYLLIRFYNLLMFMDLSYFLLFSCLTMFMSGLGANFEFDLKKIIALSTLSQLGMMMSILFMGYPNLAYFHLLSHAFFKALLFLCAGLIIHSMSDSQDIRHMGFVINYLPFTCSCFCISNLSLCGFPFLSGFYSSDLILEYMVSNYFNFFIYLIFFLSVGLTACYSFRLIYYCVSFKSGLYSCQCYHESQDMMISMVILTFMSIVFGFIFNWLILPNFLLSLFPLECKLMPMIFIIIGSLLGYEFSNLKLSTLNLDYINLLIYNYFGSMWFMINFSTFSSISMLNLSKSYVNLIDGGWCEYLISMSPLSFLSYLSKFFLSFHNNNLQFYLLGFLFWFMFLVVLFN